LIGFDHTQPDFGVKEYLENCGFIPDGISLLMTWIEFPLSHSGLTEEKKLAPCECSYGAHPYSPQRPRQDWTNYQLAALIRELHKYGIKVYLCFFNITSYEDEAGQKVIGNFCKDHLYLCETTRSGKQLGTINVLKRMSDGRFFEDIFQERTVTTLTDYDFDGIQIADGISSGRLSLQEGDYSDDMVEQFLHETGLTLPCEIAAVAEHDEESSLRRAAWIWQENRYAWIRFHCNRWEKFYCKFAARLKKAGKEAVFNNAWTRDPFEAIYRYGVDYRKLKDLGFCGCMPEDVSAGLAILSQEDNGYLMTDHQRRQIHYDFLAALMQIRAAMPKLKITPLAGVHDTMEQWGVLEHMPTSMSRNVFCNLNTMFWNGQKTVPITDGPWFCLSDSLSREQWSFIQKNWDIGNAGIPHSAAGFAWLWSDTLLDREVKQFIERRNTPGHFLLSSLLAAGAPLHTILRTEDLSGFTGDILAPNPGLLTQDTINQLMQYNRGIVWLIGEPGEWLKLYPIKQLLEEKNDFGGIILGQLNAKGCDTSQKEIFVNTAEYHFNPRTSPEAVGGLWTHPLAYPPISSAFFRAASQLMYKAAGCPKIVLREESCEILSLQMDASRWRVYVANDDYYYNIPSINMGSGRKIISVERLTGYKGYPVPFDGEVFRCRIPGRGMEIFEVITDR